jgi:hypothetical protein
MVLYNQNKRKFWCSEKTADGVSFLLSNFIRNCRRQLLMEKNNIEGDEANERIDS